MRKFPLFILALIGFNLPMTTQAEETLYVSDELPTFIHRGPGTDYRIIGSLKSGDQVQLLNTDAETGYDQVLDYKGRVAWFPKNQLSKTPSVKARIPLLEKENQALREKLTSIDSNWNNQTSEMQSKVAASDQTIANLIAENEKLKNELIRSEKKLEIAQINLDNNRRELILQWFMYGGGVAGAGLIFGLLLPHLIPRRKKRNERWMN
ncbi:SH3 domain-containing protein [Arsenophonus endosymbiont of Aphis craccivora]|uniref:TIGR04211 family SH3 domain-containing protein n=1 Tax=Arsenophonus endosymbiont of Aphis craccivora TaxID=1231049 RepID=UPI0015DC939E|nr:TIGR04211 family SH3 domain-containing protein [Arsenophonus endosymbiont of Aphis craccivora]QLK87395.1 SH3 domain-containing protein [Arsenophonus endosymbiont of Aphis craccivora]